MPLLQPRQRLTWPNPLAYPAGRIPSIDRAHLATNTKTMSAIASGTSFISMGACTPFPTPTGTVGPPKTRILGALGSATNIPASSDYYALASGTSSLTTTTMAMIFQLDVLTSGFQALVGSNTPSHGDFLAVNCLSANSQLGAFFGVGFDSGFVLQVNTPYFAGCSINRDFSNVTPSVINFVLVNLATGKINISTQTLAVGNPNGGTGFAIGCGPGSPSQAIQGSVATAMISNDLFLSTPQLLQWAAAPWSFWYPRSAIQYTTPAAPPAFLVSAVQSWPSIGRRVEIIGAD